MKEHYDPTPSVIVQCFKYSSLAARRNRFNICVRTLLVGRICCFEAQLDDMLRDQIVCGINDEQIQRRLLGESKLTLKKAIEMATSYETAIKMPRFCRVAYQHEYQHLAWEETHKMCTS